jgi:hypothetical protein
MPPLFHAFSATFFGRLASHAMRTGHLQVSGSLPARGTCRCERPRASAWLQGGMMMQSRNIAMKACRRIVLLLVVAACTLGWTHGLRAQPKPAEKDGVTRVTALRAGEVDFANLVPREQVERLTRDPQYDLTSARYPCREQRHQPRRQTRRRLDRPHAADGDGGGVSPGG